MTNESNTPVFIDFEASSLDLVASYPIEVGICMPNGDTKSWLIKPHVLWKDWSAKSAIIHGISKEQLETEGHEISHVAEELNKSLTGKVFCDAWAFDSFWLHRLFKAAKTKQNFELDSISAILTSEQVSGWQEMHESVINDLGLVRHRAAHDAKVLHETWRRITSS